MKNNKNIPVEESAGENIVLREEYRYALRHSARVAVLLKTLGTYIRGIAFHVPAKFETNYFTKMAAHWRRIDEDLLL